MFAKPTKIKIEVQATFYNEGRREAILEAAREACQHLANKVMLATGDHKLARPKITLTLGDFFTEEEPIAFVGVEEDIHEENPFL